MSLHLNNQSNSFINNKVNNNIYIECTRKQLQKTFIGKYA